MTVTEIHGVPAGGTAHASLVDGLRVASHEIRQPVAAILALAEAARLHPHATPELETYLERIIEQATDIAEAAHSVLDVAHHRPPRQEIVRVDDVLDGALESFRVTWTGSMVRRGHRGLIALGDRVLVRRCVVNVLENATRAAGPDGRVHVRARRRGNYVEVQIEDNGPGFGNVASGSRIGLALTRFSLSGMGGDLTTGSSRRTGGARVVLALPVPGAVAAELAQASAAG